jgi:hypothetical protein
MEAEKKPIVTITPPPLVRAFLAEAEADVN